MNKRLFAAALCLLVCIAAAAREGLPDKFDAGRDAVADLAFALALAKKEGKRVVVDVGGEWCTWCHVLDRFIGRHEDVRSLLQARYVWVKVNYSPQQKNEHLLSRWPRVSGYPHLFVLDPDGQLLRSQGSAELEARKDYDRKKFIAFLERYANTPDAPSAKVDGQVDPK